MDEQTMQAGLLLEAAQAQQKSADLSLKKMRAFTHELGGVIRDEARQVLLQELSALTAEGRRATEALRSIQQVTARRMVLWSLAATAVCSLVPLGLAAWLLPSGQEIARLRARHDELATRIAGLEDRGGRIDLRRCGAGARLCVRVDRKAPSYGEAADYLVVRGY